MRVLLDECVPRPLRRELRGHQVVTVQQMGWAGKKNGELLRVIKDSGIDVFVTTDQNLEYQQNLKRWGLTTIVLIAVTNRLQDLLPLAPALRDALKRIQPGQFLSVEL